MGVYIWNYKNYKVYEYDTINLLNQAQFQVRLMITIIINEMQKTKGQCSQTAPLKLQQLLNLMLDLQNHVYQQTQ